MFSLLKLASQTATLRHTGHVRVILQKPYTAIIRIKCFFKVWFVGCTSPLLTLKYFFLCNIYV